MLRTDAVETVTSSLKHGVAADASPTILEVGLVSAAQDQGSKVAGGLAAEPDVFRILAEGSYIIRVTRIGGSGTYDISLKLVVWEEDAPV